MRVVQVHEYGGPEALRLEEIPTPTPGAGQALVKVEAAGVNFLDIYQRSGAYKNPLPLSMGVEGAGTVEAVGPGVTEVAVGNPVAWNNVPGSYASHVVAPVERLAPIPAGLGFREAAAATLQGMTAHYLSHDTYPLKSGDACVVHAAAGGVGQLLVQMAKLRGARVLATVSTEAKARLAREVGADEVVLYTEQDFVTEARRMTDGKGVQVVYDSVGRDTFDRSLDALARRGYLVLFGQSSGPVAPVDPQTLNAKGSLYLTRPSLFHYVVTRQDLLARSGAVFNLLASEKVRVSIGRTYALSEAAQAQRALAGRETTGKVLLLP